MSKLFNIPPSRPWQLNSQSELCVADIDGDGRDEVVILDQAKLALGVLSYFKYGDLSDQWEQVENDQLICIQMSQAIVPDASGTGGWQLFSTDRIIDANLDGDKTSEIVIFAPHDSYIGVLKSNGTELQTKWMLKGTVPGAGQTQGWTLSPTDQLYRADFDGEDGDVIVIHNPEARFIGVLKWDGSELQTLWKVSGTVPATGGAQGWALTA
ncbi:MAG TPA: hypothetical protein VID27_05905, partial [Blastocatellia bacterium]